MFLRRVEPRLPTISLRAPAIAPSQRVTSSTSQLRTLLYRPALRNMSTQIPKTMEGVLINKTGGTDVLEFRTDLPVPVPKEGEILLRNDFVGVNFIDTYFRTGLYPAPSFPYMLGRESAGTILGLGPGETHGLAVGDRVVVASQDTYAQYSAAPARYAYRLPDGVRAETAAAVLLQGLTALTMMRESHPVREGEWVLLHAAAGGVGLLMLQMLKDVGARVVATCSTAKLDLVRRYGPDVLVDYTREDFVGAVREATRGQGVAAVFDGVGKATFEGSMECLARKGTMVSFGNASGAVPPVTIARLSQKNARLLRPTVFGYMATREEFETYTKELLEEFVLRRGIDVLVHEVYPLRDVARAHEDIEGRKTSGKLLLKP